MRLSAVKERVAKPVVPIAAVVLLLSALNRVENPPILDVAVLIVCGLILWLGWGWVRGNIVTKWVGVILAGYLALTPVLVALGLALGVGLLLLVPFFLALPFLLYDLLFRQPRKGRFARARAARRNLPT